MRPNLLLSSSELSRFTESAELADKAYALLLQQQSSWELLSNNYEGLSKVETKEFRIHGFTYCVQFNPGRIVSSSARVDEQSIRDRKCFLCPENLPEPQRGVMYDNEYILLCNPFPIFQEHFTITRREHIPQRIKESFPALLKITKDLAERYVVLYNGPKCGASAPDHLHFQAGEKGFMPIENEYEDLITRVGEKLADIDGLLVFAVGNFLRRFVSFESDDDALLAKAFDEFYRCAQSITASDDEPMMNIVSSYEDGEWRVVAFLREKHRPSFFFEEGESKMLISPAAVDLGGVIITPLERDFRLLDGEHVEQMFNEVMMPRAKFDTLTTHLRSTLSQMRS